MGGTHDVYVKQRMQAHNAAALPVCGIGYDIASKANGKSTHVM
jgi:hypothetical protein